MYSSVLLEDSLICFPLKNVQQKQSIFFVNFVSNWSVWERCLRDGEAGWDMSLEHCSCRYPWQHWEQQPSDTFTLTESLEILTTLHTYHHQQRGGRNSTNTNDGKLHVLKQLASKTRKHQDPTIWDPTEHGRPETLLNRLAQVKYTEFINQVKFIELNKSPIQITFSHIWKAWSEMPIPSFLTIDVFIFFLS